jgi:hypothetical protein
VDKVVPFGLPCLFKSGQGGETPTTLDPYERQLENVKYLKIKIKL